LKHNDVLDAAFAHMSPPARGRGLKPIRNRGRGRGAQSPPARGRGLKQRENQPVIADIM